jgi:hypothetical protein
MHIDTIRDFLKRREAIRDEEGEICKVFKDMAKGDPDLKYMEEAIRCGYGDMRLSSVNDTTVYVEVEDRDGCWDTFGVSIDKLEEDEAHRADRLIAVEAARKAAEKKERIAALKRNIDQTNKTLAMVNSYKADLDRYQRELAALENP